MQLTCFATDIKTILNEPEVSVCTGFVNTDTFIATNNDSGGTEARVNDVIEEDDASEIEYGGDTFIDGGGIQNNTPPEKGIAQNDLFPHGGKIEIQEADDTLEGGYGNPYDNDIIEYGYGYREEVTIEGDINPEGDVTIEGGNPYGEGGFGHPKDRLEDDTINSDPTRPLDAFDPLPYGELETGTDIITDPNSVTVNLKDFVFEKTDNFTLNGGSGTDTIVSGERGCWGFEDLNKGGVFSNPTPEVSVCEGYGNVMPEAIICFENSGFLFA